MTNTKKVNTLPKAVPVWPAVRYISDTGQYWCTVSGLPLFYIYIYTHTLIRTIIIIIYIYILAKKIYKFIVKKKKII